MDDYPEYGRQLNVGDIIKPTDGSDYRGRILTISRDTDTVEHQCLKTGRVWTKSYWGFGIRYEKDDG